MKKLILVMSVLGLAGCKESETGLQKNVINATYESCLADLQRALKSPRSLQVKNAVVVTYPAKASDVYRVYGTTIISEDGNEVSALTKRMKTRFREIGTSIDYEAQNSFGVYLPNTFGCSYIYQLHHDNESPEAIKISKSGEKVISKEAVGREIAVKDFSNLKLNGDIRLLIGDAESAHLKTDPQLLNDVLKEHLRSNRRQNSKLQELADIATEAVSAEAIAAAADATPAYSEAH